METLHELLQKRTYQDYTPILSKIDLQVIVLRPSIFREYKRLCNLSTFAKIFNNQKLVVPRNYRKINNKYLTNIKQKGINNK